MRTNLVVNVVTVVADPFIVDARTRLTSTMATYPGAAHTVRRSERQTFA